MKKRTDVIQLAHADKDNRIGNRIYSTKGVAVCIRAFGGGLAGKGGGLYLVRNKSKIMT